MEKRSLPPQGYYKNLATTSISCAWLKYSRKRVVLGLLEAEPIVAKDMWWQICLHNEMVWILRQPAESPSANRLDLDLRFPWPCSRSRRGGPRKDRPRVWKKVKSSSSTWGVDRDSPWCGAAPLPKPFGRNSSCTCRHQRRRGLTRCWPRSLRRADYQCQW